MGFRTLVVNSKSKIELSLNFLVVRNDDEKRIHLSEISTVILLSTAISITASALCELTKRKIRIIFCDEKSQPYGELMPYYLGCKNSKRIKEQMFWKQGTIDFVWKEIVKQKILKQANLLLLNGCENKALMLSDYASNVEPGDVTNREGHAAKVYFNNIFNKGFTRSQDNYINKCLNYGYAIVLSAVNREINSLGFLTQLGIHHCNEFNPYNLGCDLMEPFRPYVDQLAKSLKPEDDKWKHYMSDILNKHIMINDKHTTMDVAINIYVKSVTDSLCENTNLIRFPEKYEL